MDDRYFRSFFGGRGSIGMGISMGIGMSLFPLLLLSTGRAWLAGLERLLNSEWLACESRSDCWMLELVDLVNVFPLTYLEVNGKMGR